MIGFTAKSVEQPEGPVPQALVEQRPGEDRRVGRGPFRLRHHCTPGSETRKWGHCVPPVLYRAYKSLAFSVIIEE